MRTENWKNMTKVRNDPEIWNIYFYIRVNILLLFYIDLKGCTFAKVFLLVDVLHNLILIK